MASVTVKTHESYEYREVWHILEWRDDAVYKTTTTGKYIKRDDVLKLDAKKFLTSPLSTSMTRNVETITLELFDLMTIS